MVPVFRHLFTPQSSNNYHPKLLHVDGLLAVLFLSIIGSFIISGFRGSSPILPSILGYSSSITASSVVEQTNAKRSSLGIPKLSSNSKLNAAALAKGNNMCAEHYWAHISPKGTTPWSFIKASGYQYMIAGENLARDFADTASMMEAWMNSPTHRANIVQPKYKEIGVAVVNCNLVGTETSLVVQMFGAQATAAKTQNTKPKVTSTKTETVAQANTKVEGETEEIEGAYFFTPLEINKAYLIGIVILVIGVLILDLWVVHHTHIVRISGKNLAHILFLAGILILIVLFKSGRIN